jgi:hypothetical protein
MPVVSSENGPDGRRYVRRMLARRRAGADRVPVVTQLRAGKIYGTCAPRGRVLRGVTCRDRRVCNLPAVKVWER